MSKQQFTPAQKKVLIRLISTDYPNSLKTSNYKSVEKLVEMNILKMNGHSYFDFRLPQMRNWFECWTNEINEYLNNQ